MKTWNSVKITGAVMVAVFLVAPQAHAPIAFDNTPVAPNQFSTGPYQLGMDFIVNSPITVDAIGAFHIGSGDFLSTIPVAIYNVADQQQVAGTMVTFSGSPSGYSYSTDNSVFQNITPVTLGAGDYSIVAADYGAAGGEPYYWTYSPGSLTTPVFNDGGGLISLVSGGGRWAPGSVLAFPTGASGGPPGNPSPNYAAGTFDFIEVPEPPAVSVIGVGLGLIYVRRCARLRRRMKLA